MHFGKRAHDRVTGFTGTITGHCSYISGCSQLLLAPQVGADNKLESPQWFDEQRVAIDEGAPILVLDNSATPGPDKPAPVR